MGDEQRVESQTIGMRIRGPDDKAGTSPGGLCRLSLSIALGRGSPEGRGRASAFGVSMRFRDGAGRGVCGEKTYSERSDDGVRSSQQKKIKTGNSLVGFARVGEAWAEHLPTWTISFGELG